MAGDGRTRVVILGGGLGGVSAALTLTATEELRKRFDVTLVSHGWRLGGKGASGRNALEGQRIEEHGLHIFLGFYDAAFQAVRACYGEWKASGTMPANYAFQTWDQAFQPMYQVTLMQEIKRLTGAKWHAWNFDLPPRPGEPGDPSPLEPAAFIRVLVAVMKHFVGGENEKLRAVLDRLDLGKLDDILEHLDKADGKPDHNWVAGVLKVIQKMFQAIEPILELTDEGWKIACLVDFSLALGIGFVTDVLPYEGRTGFDRINGQDFREWLLKYGLNEKFEWSGPVRLLYDMCFSYVKGDTSGGYENARFAAGAGVEILFLMALAYKGAPLWKMNAGMGDTVFTPAYEVLKLRGVDVKLFHRLTDLDVSENGNWVERVTIQRQVDFKNGTYDPFVTVPYGHPSDGKFLYCWPSEPNWDQIVDGDKLKDQVGNLESVYCPYHVEEKTLELGKDFDLCVLAMPPASLSVVGQKLLAANPRFKLMVENTPAVPTQAVQLWFKPSIEEMGWEAGQTAMTSYVEALDSWGEMSHLDAAEDWKVDPPKAVEYLCGSAMMPKGPVSCGYEKTLAAAVETEARAWLDANAGAIWPNTVKKGKFDWAQVRSAYYRWNIDPSEQYVQCFPGTVETRLEPGRSGFVNAFLAGDWTRTWFSAGSADIAVLSGKQAAEAIARQSIDLTPKG